MRVICDDIQGLEYVFVICGVIDHLHAQEFITANVLFYIVSEGWESRCS